MPGFKLVESVYPGVLIRPFDMTDSEAATVGEAMVFSSGKLTLAGDAANIAGFATHALAAGTSQTMYLLIALPGMIFEVPYTGTPAAGFVVGCETCDLASGVQIDAADVTGGKFTLVSKDTANTKCEVTVNGRVFG